jgi:hypothetical protein
LKNTDGQEAAMGQKTATAKSQSDGKPLQPAEQIKIARHIFGALCAQYPTRLIVLRDESGRIVARSSGAVVARA